MRPSHVLAAAVPLLLAAGILGYALVGSDGPPGPEASGLSASGPVPEVGTALEGRAGRDTPLPQGAAGVIAVLVCDAKGRPAPGVPVQATLWWDGVDEEAVPARRGVSRSHAAANERRQWLWLTSGVVAWQPAARAVSGEDGCCELPVPQAGQYYLEARPAAPRYGTRAWANLSELTPRPRATLFVAEGFPVRGRVLTAAGAGVDAVVWAAEIEGEDGLSWSSERTATDPATGAFAWAAVPRGRGTVDVLVPGRFSFSVPVRTPPKDELLIVLPATGGLRGRVTNRAGAPVAGARLRASTQDDPARGVGAAHDCDALATSASDGAYRIEGLLPGPLASLSADADGYAVTRLTPGRGLPEAEVREGSEVVVDVVLGAGSVVEGRVRLEGREVPVADATVECLPCEGDDRVDAAACDAEGAFRFEGLPPGRYVLVATSPTCYLPARAPFPDEKSPGAQGSAGPDDLSVAVVVADGEHLVREIEMRVGLPVRGRVLDGAGAPVGGAQVSLHGGAMRSIPWEWNPRADPDPGHRASSAADGSFRIANMPPGEAWRLVAQKEGMLGRPSEPFALAAGAPEPEVVLTLGGGASLSGRAVDEGGAPVGGATVTGRVRAREERLDLPEVVTGPDGTFRWTGLPGGTIRLWVHGAGGAKGDLDLKPELEDDEARDGVEVVVRRGGGLAVRGTGVDVTGAPVARGEVELRRVGGGSGRSTRTEADGSFEFTGLEPGPWVVAGDEGPDEPDGVNSVLVYAPADGVRVRVEPEEASVKTVVAGRVVGPDGAPVPLCRVGVGSRDGVIAVGGLFRVVVEESPPFNLTAREPRGADGRRLNLLPATLEVSAAAADLVLRLEPGLELAGRVLGPAGAPVADARVTVAQAERDLPGATTDASGAFRLVGLGPGEARLGVTPPAGLQPPEIPPVVAGRTDLVIVCEAAVAVAGRVVQPDGAPFTQRGWAAAQWDGGSRRSGLGEGGTFRFEGLPPGVTVTLTADANGWEFTEAFPVQVPSGTLDAVVRLRTPVVLSGVLLDAGGRPAPRARVYAGERSDRTDGEGRFAIYGLPVGTAPASATAGPNGIVVPLGTVSVPAEGVTLRLPPIAVLAGRVVGPAADGFEVRLREQGEGQDLQVLQCEVGADGAFSFQVLPGRSYALSAHKDDDDRCAEATAQAGAPAELRLEPGLSISGLLLRADGSSAPTGSRVYAHGPRVSASADVGENGAWRVRGLLAGGYDLSAWLRGNEEVLPGGARADAGARGVVLRLEPAGPEPDGDWDMEIVGGQ